MIVPARTNGHLPLLDGIDPAERASIIAGCTPRRFGAREIVFHEGDPGDSLHVIVSGRVQVRVTSRLGQSVLLSILGQGEVVGELALLDPDARRTATVATLEPTHTLSMSRAQLTRLRRIHPQVDRFLLATLTLRIRELNAAVLEAHHVPVATRIARRLVRIADGYGGEIRLSQDDLASMAGTTRATANAVLRELQERGVLALGRNRIRIRDRSALERAAR